MILDIHLPLLRDKFVRSSWSNPELETNLTLVPTLLNAAHPNYGSFKHFRNIYALPMEGVAFDIYTLEQVSYRAFRQGQQVIDQWISLNDFCTYNNVEISLQYTDELYTPPYSESFIYYQRNGNMYLAVPYSTKARRNRLNFGIRSSNDDLSVSIDVTEDLLDDYFKLTSWYTQYNADPNKTLNKYYINGVYTRITNLAKDVTLGDRVRTVSDTSVSEVITTPLAQIPYCTKDGENYYLFNVKDEAGDTLYSKYDLNLYIVNNTIGMKIPLDITRFKQVTDKIVGIRTDYVGTILTNLGWSANKVNFTSYHRVSNKRYISNDNYLYSLSLLPKTLQQQILQGNIDNPAILKGSRFIDSPYNKGLNYKYGDLTLTNLNSFTSVQTWDSYVNAGVIARGEVDNNLSNLVEMENGSRVLISYKAGGVDQLEPSSIDSDTTHLKLGYSKSTTLHRDYTVDISDMVNPVSYVNEAGVLRKLVLGVDYFIVGDSIRILETLNDIYTLDLNTTYVTTLDVSACRIFNLPLSTILNKLGEITLVVGDRTLVPFIDYTIHDGKVSINYPGELTTVKFFFQPTLNPTKTYIEYGFTRNNSLSVNGRRLELDPSSSHFLIDGVVRLPSEITWDIPNKLSTANVANAKPYIVIRPLLSNTRDLDAVDVAREAYETNLEEIADYWDANVPVEEEVSIHSDLYRLVSAFMYEVLSNAVRDNFDYSVTNVKVKGLSVVLKDYLYILEGLDVTAISDISSIVTEIKGHPFNTPVGVVSDLYLLLEMINHEYLGNRVLIEHNFRVAQTNDRRIV